MSRPNQPTSESRFLQILMGSSYMKSSLHFIKISQANQKLCHFLCSKVSPQLGVTDYVTFPYFSLHFHFFIVFSSKILSLFFLFAYLQLQLLFTIYFLRLFLLSMSTLTFTFNDISFTSCPSFNLYTSKLDAKMILGVK